MISSGRLHVWPAAGSHEHAEHVAFPAIGVW
jgi:hypothetical protein